LANEDYSSVDLSVELILTNDWTNIHGPFKTILGWFVVVERTFFSHARII